MHVTAMGDMAEYYDERTDFDEDPVSLYNLYAEPDEQIYEGPAGLHYYPADDKAAKRIIKSMKHYDWRTRKVTGRYAPDPYRLEAVIEGQQVVIHLPGQRGNTLGWLKRKVEDREAARALGRHAVQV